MPDTSVLKADDVWREGSSPDIVVDFALRRAKMVFKFSFSMVLKIE